MQTLNNNSADNYARTTATWSAIAAILAAAVLTAGCGWWLNSRLNDQAASVANLLGMHQGMQKTVDSLNRRIIGTETALSGLPNEMKVMTGRVDALDKKVTAVRQAVAKPQPAAPPPNTAAILELAKQVTLLNERLVSLESKQDADVAKVASLSNDLTALSQDTERQITAVRGTIPLDSSAEIEKLWAAVDSNNAGIATVTRSLSEKSDKSDRERNDFEVHENLAYEVAPGVHLTIRSTNVGRQQISGWVYLENERRVVFLKNHGLLEPITVYGVRDNRAHEIVITRVRKNDAIGYVLSPGNDVKIAAGAAPEVAGLAQ